MNDNIIRAETSFMRSRKYFEFYSCLPDFRTNHVYDYRSERGRRLLIQIIGKDSILRLTEHCFYRYG